MVLASLISSSAGAANPRPARAMARPAAPVACTAEEYNASLPKETDCGASAAGPAALTASPCPLAGYTGPVRWCTPAFQLTLDVADAKTCTPAEQPLNGACLLPPGLNSAAISPSDTGLYGAELSSNWCGGPMFCDTGESVPLRIEFPDPTGYFPKTWTYVIQVYGSVAGLGGGEGFTSWVKIAITDAAASTPNSLSASISVTNGAGAPVTGQPASVGMTVVAKVVLSVRSSAVGPVTGITASPAVSVSPSNVLRLLTGPAPPIPAAGFTVLPGQQVSYLERFTLTTVGTATVSVTAHGTEAGGSADTARDSVTARFGQPLTITVNWLQSGHALALKGHNSVLADTLRLADADDGEIPEDVTASVVVKNTSSVAEENVAFNGLPPFSYATKAQSVRRLPVAITAVNDLAPESSGAADALKLGTLAPGASATVRFTVHVTNNGSFTLSPQVLSSPKGGTSTNVSEGRGTLTALPSALLWLSLHPVDPGLVPAGSEFLIAGTVTNRSLTDTLELQPLEATIDGGAGGGDLVDQAATPQPDGVELPVAGTIAPGQTIDVIGDVGTSLVPGTRATVSYHPSGTVEAADASTANLTADEIGMTAGSSPIEVHLDQSVAPPPPSTLQSIGDNFVDSTFYYAAKFSYLAFAGVGSMIASTPHAVGQIPAVLVAGGHSVGEVGELISSVLLLGTIGQAMSVEQRQRFADEVVADYKASHVKVAVDAAANTYAAVDRAAFNAFVPFENALQTGDYNTVAALAGEGFGAGLSASGDLLVSDIIFEKMLIGLGQVPAALSDAATAVKSAAKSPFADIITLEAALRDAKVVQSLAKGLPGIEAGMNLLANGAEALTNIYGLTRSQISALQQFCETNQLIIAVRSRSPRAAQLIKEGLAVGKNEIIKLKNVNEIDTTYLGYSSADLNTVVYAEPVPTSYVDAQLAANNADALTRSVVMARYKLRVEEWTLAKFRDVIENAENSGKIAWNFDGSGNAATTLIEQTRGFALKAQPSPVSTKQWPGTKGRVYEQVLVTNRAYVNGKPAIGSRLVPITQDVDAMAILTPSGEILSAVQRADVYEYLANLIGIEHGETPSWILDGEIIFQAKAKILADAIPGGEPLAVFGPDGSVTAGFYSAALSTFNNATNTGRIFFEGGYNSAYYYWNAVLKTSVGNFAGAL